MMMLVATKKDEGGDISVQFKDSLSFLGGSISSVTDLAVRSGKEFNIIKQSPLCHTNGVFDKGKFALLMRKGKMKSTLIYLIIMFRVLSLPSYERT